MGAAKLVPSTCLYAPEMTFWSLSLRRTRCRLREAIGQIGRFVVAPAAHVHDADAVAAAVADDPVQAAPDVLVGDAPHRPALDEDEPRLGRHPAIKPAREAAISARDHG